MMNDINSLFYCTPLGGTYPVFPRARYFLKTSAIDWLCRTPQGNEQNDRASPHRLRQSLRAFQRTWYLRFFKSLAISCAR